MGKVGDVVDSVGDALSAIPKAVGDANVAIGEAHNRYKAFLDDMIMRDAPGLAGVGATGLMRRERAEILGMARRLPEDFDVADVSNLTKEIDRIEARVQRGPSFRGVRGVRMTREMAEGLRQQIEQLGVDPTSEEYGIAMGLIERIQQEEGAMVTVGEISRLRDMVGLLARAPTVDQTAALERAEQRFQLGRLPEHRENVRLALAQVFQMRGVGEGMGMIDLPASETRAMRELNAMMAGMTTEDVTRARHEVVRRLRADTELGRTLKTEEDVMVAFFRALMEELKKIQIENRRTSGENAANARRAESELAKTRGG